MFITFYASINDISYYNAQLKTAGYKNTSLEGSNHPEAHRNPLHNQNLDRYYYTSEFDYALTDALYNGNGLLSEDDFMEFYDEWDYKDQKITYQIIRGEDTKRYWESIE